MKNEKVPTAQLPEEPQIALICGVPNSCDRCGEHDAKVIIALPRYGQRELCAYCLVHLVEKGLKPS